MKSLSTIGKYYRKVCAYAVFTNLFTIFDNSFVTTILGSYIVFCCAFFPCWLTCKAVVRLLPGDIFIVFVFDLVFCPGSQNIWPPQEHRRLPGWRAAFQPQAAKGQWPRCWSFCWHQKNQGSLLLILTVLEIMWLTGVGKLLSFWMCNWSVIFFFSCQCHMVEASLVTMKMMIFSALPRLSLWYQLFILRLGEDRKQMLS